MISECVIVTLQLTVHTSILGEHGSYGLGQGMQMCDGTVGQAVLHHHEGLRWILYPLRHGLQSATEVCDATLVRTLSRGELALSSSQLFLLGVEGVLSQGTLLEGLRQALSQEVGMVVASDGFLHF